MQLLKIYYAYFSPGNTTEKVVSHIASSFQNYPVESINLTDYATRQEDYYFKENELLIIGVPAYGGRVPAPVVDALRHFTGSNTPVVLVATYGNRDIDDTLIELKKNVIDKGFIPVGAASFVCQHTFLKECAEGSESNPKEIDSSICLRCGSCLRICPTQAKYFTEEPFKVLQEKLSPLCGVRKENWYTIA